MIKDFEYDFNDNPTSDNEPSLSDNTVFPYNGISESVAKINAVYDAIDYSGIQSALLAFSICSNLSSDIEGFTQSTELMSRELQTINNITCPTTLFDISERITGSVRDMSTIADTVSGWDNSGSRIAVPSTVNDIPLAGAYNIVDEAVSYIKTLCDDCSTELMEGAVRIFQTVCERFSVLHEIIHALCRSALNRLEQVFSGILRNIFNTISNLVSLISLPPPLAAIHYDIRAILSGPSLLLVKKKFMGIASRIHKQLLKRGRNREGDSDLPGNAVTC